MNIFKTWIEEKRRAKEAAAKKEENAQANDLDNMKAVQIAVDGAGEDAVMFILTVSGRVFSRSLWMLDQWQEIQTPKEAAFFKMYPKP